MKEATLSVAGMHCGSCSITIKRALSKIPSVQNVVIQESSGILSFSYEDGQATPEQVARTIAEKGYAVTAPGIRFVPNKSLKDRAKFFLSDPSTAPEREAVQTGLMAAILLSVMEFFILRGLFPGTDARVAYLLVYVIIAVSAIGASLWHFFSFRREVPCMTGMMVGMTFGMITGFLIGTFVAATNGILIGTVYGVLAGMIVGAWAGKCCGVMGLMEGMMAGLMSGVMGGMIPLMFFSENLFLFLPILTGSCIIILAGLGHAVSWENREFEKAHGTSHERSSYGFVPFISICFFIVLLTTVLMVAGPKSALVALGV